MKSFTPGPWTAEGQADHVVALDYDGYATANDGHSIATVYGPDAAENARLIAAAPTLLSALERLSAHHQNGDDYDATVVAEEAIALARKGRP